MKDKVRKIGLIAVLALIVLCFACVAFACGKKDGGAGDNGDGDTPSTATLVDFENETKDIEYGSSYTVIGTVYDTDGNAYSLTASVKDCDDNAVTDNPFTANKSSYTVVYKVSFKGEDKTKTVTLNVCSRPVINVDKTERTYNLGILPYSVPEITVNDALDGEIEDYVKEIWYKDVSGDVKTLYNGTAATFAPDKTGEYYLKITATNSKGFSNEVKIKFTVKEAVRDFIPSENTAKDFYKDATRSTFVAAADIPTTYEDGDGETQSIDNSVGYDGDALKMDMGSGNIPYIRFPLSASEIESLSSTYATVKFSWLAVGNTAPTNNHGNGSFDGLISAADIKGALPMNVWQTAEITLQKFAEILRAVDNDDNTLFLFRPWISGAARFDFYLGEITLEEPKPLEAKDLIASASTAKYFYNGNALSSFVDKADIPTVGINNAVGYSGNALKINMGTGNIPFVEFSLTAAEFESIKSNYVGVQLSYLVVPLTANTPTNNSGDGSFAGLISATGIGKDQRLPCNIWQTCVIALDDFIETMGENPTDWKNKDNNAFLFRPWIGGGDKFDFYLGDIKFLKTAYSNSVEISSAKQLYDISAAVKSGMTLSDISYTLTEDVTIDCDFTPISNTFAGNFTVASGKKIYALNCGTTLPTVFADSAINDGITVETIVSGLTVTKNTVDRVNYRNSREFASNSDVTFDKKDYAGDFIKFTINTGSAAVITLNYTKAELQAMLDSGKYTSLRFGYYFDCDVDSIHNNATVTLFRSENIAIVKESWVNLTVKLSAVISAMAEDTSKELTVVRPYFSNQTKSDFYLGDIEIIYEDRIFLMTEQFVDSFYAKTQEGVLSKTADFILNKDLPDKEYYRGNALKLSTVGSGNFIFIKPFLTLDELKAIKDNYSAIEFNFYVTITGKQNAYISNSSNTANPNNFCSLAGISGNLPGNTWTKKTITIEQLIASMESVITRNTTTIDDDGDTAFFVSIYRDARQQTSSGSENLAYTDPPDFYLGDITLIPKTAN